MMAIHLFLDDNERTANLTMETPVSQQLRVSLPGDTSKLPERTGETLSLFDKTRDY